MDLEAFITKTLKSIKAGIHGANEGESNKMFKINPEAKVVNFDVAVVVGKENTTSGGGGLSIKVLEGKLGKSSKTNESNVTRINFTVGVNTIID